MKPTWAGAPTPMQSGSERWFTKRHHFGLNESSGRSTRWKLETAYPACNQQKAQADDPGPGCKWLRNPGNPEVCSKRHEKQDQADDPDGHRRGLTRVAHCYSFGRCCGNGGYGPGLARCTALPFPVHAGIVEGLQPSEFVPGCIAESMPVAGSGSMTSVVASRKQGNQE